MPCTVRVVANPFAMAMAGKAPRSPSLGKRSLAALRYGFAEVVKLVGPESAEVFKRGVLPLGAVTASFADAPGAAAITVARYLGVDAAAPIGAVTEPWTEHLKSVVKRDKRAGQHGRERELDEPGGTDGEHNLAAVPLSNCRQH